MGLLETKLSNKIKTIFCSSRLNEESYMILDSESPDFLPPKK